MEILYGPLSKTLNVNRKPFTLVLSNQGAIANGYVTLAPRKSEWYQQPSQGNCAHAKRPGPHPGIQHGHPRAAPERYPLFLSEGLSRFVQGLDAQLV